MLLMTLLPPCFPSPSSFLYPFPSFLFPSLLSLSNIERTMRLRVAKPPAQRESPSSHWSDS